MRTFTNGIVWWTQEKYEGDDYASHVVMICKHVLRTFRWHCLEVLPLWRWSGKDGEEPPPPDPLPTTDKEWEAEVRKMQTTVTCAPNIGQYLIRGPPAVFTGRVILIGVH